MAEPSEHKTDRDREPQPSERDKPVKIDLDPEVALRALLEVDPNSAPQKVDKRG